jgi:hypothetical protein
VFPAIVEKLAAVLGKKLTAYIGGARDVRAVERWMSGAEPYRNGEERIRFAYLIANMLATREDPKVVQAWFTGLNPELDDRAPIRLFQDPDFELARQQVLAAARSFLTGG